MPTEFLDPQKILNQLELRKNMLAADFGCGSGGWTIPLAKILEDGRVYAIDILEEPLSVLKRKTQSNKISNIRTIRANLESDKEDVMREIAWGSLDLVLMTSLLFQIEDKSKPFFYAKKTLKTGGKVLVIDWKPAAPFGPKEGRVSAEEAKDLALKMGFRLEKEFDAGVYHYGLVLEKP